jgi:heme o synthase
LQLGSLRRALCNKVFKIYSDLTKFGIVIFVMLSGIAGYATSFPIEKGLDWPHLLAAMWGLYFLSSGSLALNQWQERELDALMPRTSKRPIVSGKITSKNALIIALALLAVGAVLLFASSVAAGLVGLASVLLYNFLYTKLWKRKWIFAAVPGAIPGALPVTIGYAANNSDLLQSDSIYLFLIMFFWQMPHFWALALKYKDDYEKGGVPTLPVSMGGERTLYHIGIYTFAFVITAIAAPWFVHASWAYLALVLPFCFKIMQEFWRFFKSGGKLRWFAFFMWVNIAMLIFIFVPVFDKWSFLILPHT